MDRIQGIVALALFTGLLISCSPTRKYAKSAEKWAAAMLAFDSLNANNNYPEHSILFVGCSSIRLWDGIESDMAPYAVIQRGYGGASYSDLAYYIRRIVYPHRCDAIVLFAGNDIWGTEEDRSPKDISRLAKYIIKSIRKKYGEAPVFIIEVTHVPVREHLIAQIDAENKALKSVCEDFTHVHWVPTREIYVTADKINHNLFAADKIHQNEEGYKRWTEAIKKEIKAVLK